MTAHYRIKFSDAIAAHQYALLFGGRAGIINENGLHSAISRPYNGYFRFIHEKSAALMHAVIANHPFADANKRTALQLTLLLIRRSGYELNLMPGERLDDIVVDVAAKRLEFKGLCEWFECRLVRANR
ncbi:type II toxin-antitoxin system death-on-curing family toxin [Marivivens marinus]|uniref:type II toxin-antitoxin system death-on-curing family toxin n=1 Tax=Marivivens marinus TaxID=3110173 RepID=UPI003B8483FF